MALRSLLFKFRKAICLYFASANHTSVSW